MNLEWAIGTSLDLRSSIFEYVERHFPAGSTAALIDRIIARTEAFRDTPMLGAAVEDSDDPALRELLERPYRVYPDRVEIVAVIHSARRLPRSL